MIILEGCDKAGKTTLANELSKEYGLPVKHFGVPEPGSDPCTEYADLMQDTRGPMLLDRFIYGEIIYSKVKKRESFMDELAFTSLDMMLASMPHTVIFCRPLWEEVERRLRAEPDDYVNIGEARQVYEEYDERMMDLGTNLVMYDGTNKEAVLRACDQAVDPDRWERYFHWRRKGMPGVGTLEPDVLVVGERFNFAAKHQVTFWSKSGAYLYKALRRTGVPFSRLHLTNALSPDLAALSEKQIDFLNPRIILPLGAHSWHVVKVATGRAWPKAPHPGYFSRFRHDELEEYSNMLVALCRL